MTEKSPKIEKTSISIPEGFPDMVFQKAQQELKARAPRGLVFQNRGQRNTAFIQKGIAKPGNISYDTLRRAAQSVHVIRICIHTLKQKVTKTKWVIQNVDVTKRKANNEDPRIEELTKFFKKPNTQDTLRTLLDKMVEDLLVLDAVSLEKTRYMSGELAALYFVDSATVRPVFNDRGEQDILIPLKTKDANGGFEDLPVSYVQVLNNSQYGGPESGDIVAAWNSKDFIHFHMNPQGAMESFGYGLSPIEGVLSVVANLLNADNFNGTYFEEGAFPPVILQLIGQVNPRDLEAYREYLVSELTGNFHRPAIMATEKAESLQIHNLKDMTNRDMQFMEYQLWLAKLACAMYGMSPEDIGITDTTGSKSVSEVQKQLSEDKGYSSILHLIKEIFNDEIIAGDFGYDDLEFDWVAMDTQDPEEASQMHDRDLRNGTSTLNEVRLSRGKTPFGNWADEPMILGANGYEPLDPKVIEENEQKELMENNEKKEDGEKPVIEKMQKAVFTMNGYRTWMDDRGYSQPFIFMDIQTGRGTVIKPPAAVNLQSQQLEIDLTAQLNSMGLNVVPVFKRSYVEVVEMLRNIPDVFEQFMQYVNMEPAYDSEKWKAKFGGSRKFNYYLVTDYIDGYPLNNPLLKSDMERDPNSYIKAVKDLANLWKVEKELVLGDRRADQYVITHDKRAFGFDYQFEGDYSRWEKTQDAIREQLREIPQLLEVFDKEVKKKDVIKRIMKKLRH